MSRTPRQQLSAWMRREIEGQEAVNLPDLARRVVEAHSDDVALLRAWWADTAYAVAYGLGTQICADARTPVEHEPADAGAGPRPRRPGFFERLEHVGTHYLRFGDMTRRDLLAFAAEREGPALTELRLVGLARRLAGRMADDGKRVREVFREEEIERWDRLLKVRWSANIPLPKALDAGNKEAAD